MPAHIIQTNTTPFEKTAIPGARRNLAIGFFSVHNPADLELVCSGIDEEQAADLFIRLAPFASDWNSPEMDIYDNYDAARSAR